MTVSTRPIEPRGSDFAGLSRQVREAGLLGRRRVDYGVRIAVTGLVYVATWAVFLAVGNSWYQMFVAVALGLAFTQVAFLGHDGGHQQICRTRIGNDVVGLLAGDLLAGLSYGWWLDKHNRHHAHPNHEGRDPDVGDAVFAFTVDAVARRTGTLGRFVVGHQAWLFFPLLTFEGFHLHVASARFLGRGRTGRYRRVEWALFGVHIVGYLAVIGTVLSPLPALVFVVVHQGVFGLYMGCSFAPNHKGMRIVTDDEQIDYLRRQVLTSRNVRGGWFTDVLLGGLGYQIEHHLFPNMPRTNLRRAQRVVRRYCGEHGIAYTEVSLPASYAIALAHLHRLGRPLRGSARSATRTADPGR